MDEEAQAIVVDCGSDTIRAGFAGEAEPRAVFPCLVGRPRPNAAVDKNVDADASGNAKGLKDAYVGDDLESRRNQLTVKQPIDKGIVTNWDDMEKIWYHTFYNELRVSPEEHPLMTTEVPNYPKANREKQIKLMFETFNTPSYFVSLTNVMILYSTGRTTGLVLDVGDTVCTSAPIYEGYCFPHAVKKLNLGGRDVTQRLQALLTERGYVLNTLAGREVVKDMKHKLSYVALDFDEEKKKSDADVEQSYELPDGEVVKVGSELFRCNEVLFQPKLIGVEKEKGVHLTVYDTYMTLDHDARMYFTSNLILSGGASKSKDFEQRLKKELKHLWPTSMARVLTIVTAPDRHAAWTGGSILASLSTFQQMWVTKDDYDEWGPIIVHRTCF